jgi:hypothetical protein
MIVKVRANVKATDEAPLRSMGFAARILDIVRFDRGGGGRDIKRTRGTALFLRSKRLLYNEEIIDRVPM